MTKEEVEKAAKESPRAAILCSIEHHQQLITASVKEIGEAERNEEVDLDSTFCALCKRTTEGSCAKCPIYDGDEILSCCIEWREAYDLFSPTESNISEFRAAESRLIAKLYKALADCPEEPIKKQVEKPRFKHGDYNGEELFLKRREWIKDEEKTHKNFPVNKDGALTNIPIDTIVGPILGNIFDDMAAKKNEGEDLREFEVTTHHGGILKIRIEKCRNADIVFNIPTSHLATANLKEAKEIHQKLGQMTATAERDKAKDCSHKK